MNDSTLRNIWLCADDYGISPSVNAAIRDLIMRGRLNATSVMVAAPSFQPTEAAALVEQARSRAAIGLHVTLTAPFRPLSPDYAPVRDGRFPPLVATARHAFFNALQPELVEREIARQFAAFHEAFGRAPDYVDGHQHAHLFPKIGAALLRVIKNAAPQAWVRQCERAVSAPKPVSDPKGLILDALSRRFRHRAAQARVPTNPAFAGSYSFRADADFAKLFPSFLDALPDGGVVMCHPGIVDAELIRLDPLTKLREREYAYFSADGFPDLLARHGFALRRVATS